MTEQDLLRLKKRVEDAERTTSELKGQQTILTKQLKDEFGCKSLEEAKIKLENIKSDIDKLDTKIENSINEINEKYE